MRGDHRDALRTRGATCDGGGWNAARALQHQEGTRETEERTRKRPTLETEVRKSQEATPQTTTAKKREETTRCATEEMQSSCRQQGGAGEWMSIAAVVNGIHGGSTHKAGDDSRLVEETDQVLML
jgi:flagellar biosynthesis/type III secretory pathway M-ring protein FliF/YscJ